MKYSYHLNINQDVINSGKCVKLLGVEIDNRLSFEKCIATLAKKASNQLNCLLNSFVYSNFNYCPLVWHFLLSKITKQDRKNTRTSSQKIYNDFPTKQQWK